MALVKKVSGSNYKVTFTYESKTAKIVQLLGDFNGWDSKSSAMKSAKGKFTSELTLAANASYQFRYLIDGTQWDNDSAADFYVDSPFSGIQNSVVILDPIKSATKTAPAKTVAKTPAAKTEKVAPAKKVATPKTTTKAAVKAEKVAPAKKPEAPKVAKPIAVAKSVGKPAKAKVEKTATAKKVTAPKVVKADDLKLIEGVGPKIAEILVKNNINTFKTLATTNPSDLKKILENAGSKFVMHDPSTWPQQAKLADKGDMKALKKLQDELIAGKKK
jgi:predicted flap endonuclease-1-like 5' DNA nuclease